MLDDRECRRAGMAILQDLMQVTHATTLKDLSSKIGVSQGHCSKLVASPKWSKTRRTVLSAARLDQILDKLPPEDATPEFRAKMHRLAARTRGYEV